MKVSFCVSTVYERMQKLSNIVKDLKNQNDSRYELVVVVQTEEERKVKKVKNKIGEITKSVKSVKHKVCVGKGLSKSRNYAISLADGDIILIVDDDCRYKKDACKNVIRAYEKYEKEIITFSVKEIGDGEWREYPDQAHTHTPLSLLGVSSIEISFRKSIINNKSRPFDERFGLGAKWPTGEETIFLFDRWWDGHTIQFVPVSVAEHGPRTQHIKKGLPALRSKGAMFHRCFGKYIGFLVFLVFVIRKNNYISFYKTFEAFRAGVRGFLEFSD